MKPNYKISIKHTNSAETEFFGGDNNNNNLNTS